MGKSKAAKIRSRDKERVRRSDAEITGHLYHRKEKQDKCVYCGAPAEITNRVVSVSVAAEYMRTNKIGRIKDALLIVDACRSCASTAQGIPFPNLEAKIEYILRHKNRWDSDAEEPEPRVAGRA